MPKLAVSAREFLSMRSPSARLWAVGTAVVLLASTAFVTGMVSRASAALALMPEEAAATAVASASIVPAGTVVEAVAPSSIAAEATPAAIPAQLPAPASPSDVMSRKVRFSVRPPGAMVIKIARVFAFDSHAFSAF